MEKCTRCTTQCQVIEAIRNRLCPSGEVICVPGNTAEPIKRNSDEIPTQPVTPQA